MARSNYDIQIQASSQGAIAAFEQLQRKAEQLNQKLEDGSKRNNKAAKDTGKAFGTWTNSLGRATMAAVGLGGALQGVYTIAALVSNELKKVEDLQKRSGERSLEFSDALMALNYQLPADSDMDISQIRNIIMSSGTANPSGLASIIQGTISADLSQPVSQRVKIATELAELRPDLLTSDPDALKSLSIAVMQTTRTAAIDPLTGEKPTAVQQAGLILSSLTASQLSDVGLFAENMAAVPSAVSQIAPGVTQHELFAFMAALSTASADMTGETTRSNTTSFVSQMTQELKASGVQTDEMRLTEIVAAVRQSPEIRRRMLGVLESGLSEDELLEFQGASSGELQGELRGRVKSRVILGQMISGTSNEGDFADLFGTALVQIPSTPQDAERFVRQRQAQFNSTPEAITKAMELAKEGYLAQSDIDNRNPIAANARELMKEIIERNTGSRIQSTVSTQLDLLTSGDSTPEESVAKVRQALAGQMSMYSETSYMMNDMDKYGRWTLGVQGYLTSEALGMMGLKPDIPTREEAERNLRHLESVDQRLEALQEIMSEQNEIMRGGLQVQNIERTEPVGAGQE